MNKTSIVTGASSGIGKAIALTLASEGYTVIALGRDTVKLQSLKNSSIHPVQIDLTSDEELNAFVLKVLKKYQSIDVLVHSAGTFYSDVVENANIEEFDKQYKLNVRAPYLLTKLLLPELRNSQGEIVFINSTAGLQTHATTSQYSATKFALKAFADTLRQEVNEQGIRVVSIYPGKTATPLQEQIQKKLGRKYNPSSYMQPEDIAKTVQYVLSMPRTTEVTDIMMRPFKK